MGGQVITHYVMRKCEICRKRFAQRFGRGRPRKHCGPRCVDVARNQKNKARKVRRFKSVDDFHAWQRSPARRAELSRKLKEHHRAVSRVVDACGSVEDLIEQFGEG